MVESFVLVFMIGFLDVGPFRRDIEIISPTAIKLRSTIYEMEMLFLMQRGEVLVSLDVLIHCLARMPIRNKPLLTNG